MRRRGLVLMEIMIAALVAAMAFLTFMSVFRSSYQYASMTRNRAVAAVLARTYLAEFDAHPYGSVAPLDWSSAQDVPVQIWIEGKPTDMTFHKTISYLNQSFIGGGSTTLNSDVVTLTISWAEGGVGDATKTPTANDNKQLVIQVPVWR